MILKDKEVHMYLHGSHVPWCSHKVQIPGLVKRNWHKEVGFQIYCVTWLRKQFLLKRDPRYAHLVHVPNEGLRSPNTALILKLMGMEGGIPDLLQFELKYALELKLEGESISPKQRKWLAYFKAIGYHSEVVRSFERFREIVEAS